MENCCCICDCGCFNCCTCLQFGYDCGCFNSNCLQFGCCAASTCLQPDCCAGITCFCLKNCNTCSCQTNCLNTQDFSKCLIDFITFVWLGYIIVAFVQGIDKLFKTQYSFLVFITLFVCIGPFLYMVVILVQDSSDMTNPKIFLIIIGILGLINFTFSCYLLVRYGIYDNDKFYRRHSNVFKVLCEVMRRDYIIALYLFTCLFQIIWAIISIKIDKTELTNKVLECYDINIVFLLIYLITGFIILITCLYIEADSNKDGKFNEDDIPKLRKVFKGFGPWKRQINQENVINNNIQNNQNKEQNQKCDFDQFDNNNDNNNQFNNCKNNIQLQNNINNNKNNQFKDFNFDQENLNDPFYLYNNNQAVQSIPFDKQKKKFDFNNDNNNLKNMGQQQINNDFQEITIEKNINYAPQNSQMVNNQFPQNHFDLDGQKQQQKTNLHLNE